MQIQENISLKPYNTFGIDARARYFSTFGSVNELIELLNSPAASSQKNQLLIIGGGSNLLFRSNVDGLVLKNEIKGIEKVSENDEEIVVSVGAGENWHQFVLYCIENNWAGVENLSLIPGCVGAAPMQNIGAYGVELSQVFQELKAFHLGEKTNYTFTNKDCEFGYRDSIFKKKYPHQFAIMNVKLKLRKKPVYQVSYGAIQEELNRMGVGEMTISAISQAVINIRRSKLPDPAEIGNAGSFFKNPVVPQSKFDAMQKKFDGIVGYKNEEHDIKIAAGWLIEHCGPQEGVSWKGYRQGDAGCHAKQALVLVNYGYASGKEIFDLSEEIRKSVKNKFDVDLEREVNIKPPI